MLLLYGCPAAMHGMFANRKLPSKFFILSRDRRTPTARRHLRALCALQLDYATPLRIPDA